MSGVEGVGPLVGPWPIALTSCQEGFINANIMRRCFTVLNQYVWI